MKSRLKSFVNKFKKVPSTRWVSGLFLVVILLSILQITVGSFSNINVPGSFWQQLQEVFGQNQNLQYLVATGQYKPLFTNDNYSRCQDKLGSVALSLRGNGGGYNDENFRAKLRYLFSLGVKYIVIEIDGLPATNTAGQPLVENTKLALAAARESFLIPIINITNPSTSSAAADLQAMQSFYEAIAVTGQPFVATTTPDAVVASGDVTRAMTTSMPLAEALHEYPNILVAAPNMRLKPDKSADQLELFVNSGLFDNSNRESLNEEMPYDVMLFTVTNRDSDFKNTNRDTSKGGKSEWIKTGHWLYSDPMGGQRFTAKQFIRDRNRTNVPVATATNHLGESYKINSKPFVQAIIMGFEQEPGSLPNGMNQATIERFMNDYARFSQDPTVMGVVLGDRLERAVRDGFDNNRIDVSLDEFYTRLNRAGTNCNYDIADEGIEYNERSIARSCAMRAAPENGNREIEGRVVCERDGTQFGRPKYKCQVNIKTYIQFGLPIRLCGSNTPMGTDTKSVTPYSVRVSDVLSDGRYDLLNQFGSHITFNGQKYFVPWLGTCINSAGQMQRVFGHDQGIEVLDAATRSSTNQELGQEKGKEEQAVFDDFSLHAFSPDLPYGQQEEYLDEQVVYLGAATGFHKRSSDVLNTLQSYNPREFARNSKKVNVCGGKVGYVNIDPQNMIYGSEMLYDEAGWIGTGAEMCYEIANPGGHRLQAPNYRAFCHETGQGTAEVPCTCDDWSGKDPNNPATLIPPPLTFDNVENNGCRASDRKINRCFAYTHQGNPKFGGNDGTTTYLESDVVYPSNQPRPPADMEVDGIYDALAESYIALQRELSHRNLKMIFNEKRGWEASLVVKSYINMPPSEATFLIEEGRENKMLEGVRMGSGRPSGGSDGGSDGGTDGPTVPGGPGGQCKIGVNFASPVGINQGEIDKAGSLGYGHGLLIINGPEAATDPVVTGQLSTMCNSMVPVVRSCVHGQCGFSDGAQQGAALAQLSQNISCGAQAYYACGHNEAISEYEVSSGLDRMRAEGRWSRDCADAFRANGGQGNLMSTVFNGTYNDGVTEYVQHVSAYAEGFGGTAAVNSSFSCLGINVYAYPGTVSSYLDRIASTGVTLPFCVTETGVSSGAIGTGNPSPEANAEVAVELANRSDVTFALGFNWTNANASWASFAPTDCGKLALQNACGIPFSNTSCTGGTGGNNGGGNGGNASSPEYQRYYSSHLTEGDNWNEYKFYFENLYYLDEIARLLDVYGGAPAAIQSVEFQEEGSWFRSGDLEHFAGLYTCDDYEHLPEAIAYLEEIREITGDPEYMPNCIGTSVVPGSAKYKQDPLGQFLCLKGYDIGAECDVQCRVPNTNPDTNNVGVISNPTTPSVDPTDVEQSNVNLYPVGSDLQVPNCSEPAQVRVVNTDLPYYAGEGVVNSDLARQHPFKLIPQAATAFERMIGDMPTDVRNTCAVNWGYRSAALQASFGGSCGRGTGTACSCYSEHQLGTAVDFIDRSGESVGNFAGTACEQWLTGNAVNYGFVLSYKPENPDGYGAAGVGEPWHWRWLPGNHAAQYREQEAEVGHLKNYLLELAGAETPDGNSTTGEFTNPTCPITTNLACTQGPMGDVSHMCSEDEFKSPAYDLVGSGLVAPEDGVITRADGVDSPNTIQCGSSGSTGATLEFYGDSGVHYRLMHLGFSAANSSGMVGTRLRGGQPFEDSSGTQIGFFNPPAGHACLTGPHLHIVARIGGNGQDFMSGQYVNMYHLMDEVLKCPGTDAQSCGDQSSCPADWVDLTDTTTNVNEDGLICEETDDTPDSGVTVPGCNEFNCFAAGVDTFAESLSCAANTLRNDVTAGKGFALTLDEYGPYCDTITLRAQCTFPNGQVRLCSASQARENPYTSTMPFGSNFLNIYNSISPVKCNVTLPRAQRLEDIGKRCSDFGPNFRTNDAWDYYMAPLNACNNQLTWDSVASGKSVDQVTDEIIAQARYQANTQFIITMGDDGDRIGGPVPREKVKAVVARANQEGINPYLLIGIWGTESYFGKADQKCNVY